MGGSASAAAPTCTGIISDPGALTGSYAAYLGYDFGNGPGNLSQAMTTASGQVYDVEFWLALGDYQGTSIPNSMVVKWNGATLTALTNIAAQGYTYYAFQVVGTGGADVLSFTSATNPSWRVLVDVSVTAVPEPASLLLLGSGLAAIAARRRMKTRA